MKHILYISIFALLFGCATTDVEKDTEESDILNNFDTSSEFANEFEAPSSPTTTVVKPSTSTNKIPENVASIVEDESIDQWNEQETAKQTEPIISEDEKIDMYKIFKANNLLDYYGMPVLILRMSGDYISFSDKNMVKSTDIENATVNDMEKLEDIELTEEEIKVQKQAQKLEEEKLKKEKQRNDENELLSQYLDVGSPRSTFRKDLKKIDLTADHEKLLSRLLAKANVSKKYVLLMYVNGSQLTNWTSDDDNIARTIYSQYVTNYFYKNSKNIRVEKRFVTGVPLDEIFLILLNYEGDIPINIYNIEKGSTLRWLDAYRELEAVRQEEEKKRKKELQDIISSSGEIPSIELTPATEAKTTASKKEETSPLARRPVPKIAVSGVSEPATSKSNPTVSK